MNDLSKARQDTVKAADPDRYLAALTAPADLAEKLLALYAFNNEIARVREVASEPMVGAIRLQWWRDTLAEGAPVQDPVADGILGLISAGHLTPADLAPLIDAREADLEDPVIETWDALDQYCDQTAGELMRLALKLAGDTESESADLVTAAGRCWGITGLARAFPFHAGQGRVYMPAEAFADVDLDPHEVLQGKAPKQAFAILYAAMIRAQDYFHDAKPLIRRMPKHARGAVNYIAFHEIYGRQLRSRPGEAYLIHPDIPAFRKQIKLMMSGLG